MGRKDVLKMSRIDFQITAVRTPDNEVTLTGYQTEMVYSNIHKCTPIAAGVYLNIPYVVLNLGTHPCAYIRIPDDSTYANMGYENIPLYSPHGGLTFMSNKGMVIGVTDNTKLPILYFDDTDSDKLIPNRDNTIVLHGIWIGWDYCHGGDYYCTINGSQRGHKWDTDSILDEVFATIREFKAL